MEAAQRTARVIAPEDGAVLWCGEAATLVEALDKAGYGDHRFFWLRTCDEAIARIAERDIDADLVLVVLGAEDEIEDAGYFTTAEIDPIDSEVAA